MNEFVKEILELLKYTLPSGIVGLTAYYILRQFLNEKQKLEIMRARAEARIDTLPTRLQAYERLILLLERIEPSNLIGRVYQPGMSARILQRELLKTVRDEYEHNLTQQLYVSNDCWNAMSASKDSVNQLIQLAAAKVTDSSSGADLSSILFEILGKAGVSPTAASIEKLKLEARQLF